MLCMSDPSRLILRIKSPPSFCIKESVISEFLSMVVKYEMFIYFIEHAQKEIMFSEISCKICSLQNCPLIHDKCFRNDYHSALLSA